MPVLAGQALHKVLQLLDLRLVSTTGTAGKNVTSDGGMWKTETGTADQDLLRYSSTSTL